MILSIKNRRFINWRFIDQSPSGYMIYQNQNNTEAAMVDPRSGAILWIMDIATKLPIYTNPNIKKYLKKNKGRKIDFDKMNIKQI